MLKRFSPLKRYYNIIYTIYIKILDIKMLE